MATVIQYEFDPTGEKPENLITERHVLSPANRGEYNFILPNKAPFYPRSLVVRRIDGNEILLLGKDYLVGGLYPEIIKSTKNNVPVRSTIIFQDPSIRGEFEITYQTLGGEMIPTPNEVIHELKNRIHNPFIVQWSQVIERPITYPPAYHQHHPTDLNNYSDWIEVLEKLQLTLVNYLNPNDQPDIQQLIVGLINQGELLHQISDRVDRLQAVSDKTIGNMLNDMVKELEQVLEQGRRNADGLEQIINARLDEILRKIGQEGFLPLTGGTVTGILGWKPVKTNKTDMNNREYIQRWSNIGIDPFPLPWGQSAKHTPLYQYIGMVRNSGFEYTDPATNQIARIDADLVSKNGMANAYVIHGPIYDDWKDSKNKAVKTEVESNTPHLIFTHNALAQYNGTPYIYRNYRPNIDREETTPATGSSIKYYASEDFVIDELMGQRYILNKQIKEVETKVNTLKGAVDGKSYQIPADPTYTKAYRDNIAVLDSGGKLHAHGIVLESTTDLNQTPKQVRIDFMPWTTSRQFNELNINAVIGATDFYNLSDRRLKESRVPITKVLHLVKNLKTYQYRMKPTHRKSIGVIAQEVQKYFPELVGESMSGYLHVNYQGLTALLLSAINEMAERQDELENRLSLLEKTVFKR